jgi:hypothetical protein
MFNGICADDFKHIKVKEDQMVLAKCPNCHEWFDLKYGILGIKLIPSYPRDLYFCKKDCAVHFLEKFTERRLEPSDPPSWQRGEDND